MISYFLAFLLDYVQVQSLKCNFCNHKSSGKALLLQCESSVPKMVYTFTTRKRQPVLLLVSYLVITPRLLCN